MQTRTRTRARTDRFTLRGWTMPFHELRDQGRLNAVISAMIAEPGKAQLLRLEGRRDPVEIRPGDLEIILPQIDWVVPGALAKAEAAVVETPTEESAHAQAPDLSPPDVGGVVSPSDRSAAGGVEGGGATLIPTGQPIGSDVVPPVAPKPDYSNWTDGYVKPEATLSDAETDALKARVKELEDALAAKDAAVSEIDEPMPDALAVLVPQDQRGRERDFLMARWIELNAYIMDSALPVSQRKLPDMTAAQRAEFDQLNTYKSWFN